MPLNLLVVKIDSTYPEVINASGDYDVWFRDAIKADELAITVVDVLREDCPDASGFDAIILAGSSHSVNESNPRLTVYRNWVRELLDVNVPTLGVCFGHQMMASAFGGDVQRHPMGRQFGVADVSISAADTDDYLFRNLGESVTAHACHEDVCIRLPSVAKRLASSAHTEIQSFAIGNFLRAVQFHPEVTTAIMTELHDALKTRGLLNSTESDTPLTRLRSAEAQNVGQKILANFIQFAIDNKA